MQIETLAPGQVDVVITKNGHYRIHLHRDASNMAHVDVFALDRLVDMGQGVSLLEAQMDFDSKVLMYSVIDNAIGK